MNFFRTLLNKRKSNNDIVCPVCLIERKETKINFFSIKCGHIYCQDCIASLKRNNKSCPLCQNRIISELLLVNLTCRICYNKENLHTCENCSTIYCNNCCKSEYFTCKQCKTASYMRHLFI